MSDFANSFGAGFFGAINENMERRKADADDWYAQRYEQAQQIAMQRRGKASGKIDSYVSTAQQLEGLGVPKDIVLATANQNPEDLNAMYKNVSEWQYAGIPMDEDFFRAAFKVKGVVSPNTTYEEFFTQMYLPVKNAAEADPEAFKADPEGSIFASLMGYNAQEKAQQKLSETDIMGRPADAWLYDTEERRKPAGDAGVDIDYGMLGQATQQAKDVDPSDIYRMSSEWDKQVELLTSKYVREGMEATEAARRANQETAADFAGMAQNSPEIAAVLPKLPARQSMYFGMVDEPKTWDGSLEGVEFLEDLGNGTSRIIDGNGEELVVSNLELEEAVKRDSAPYVGEAPTQTAPQGFTGVGMPGASNPPEVRDSIEGLNPIEAVSPANFRVSKESSPEQLTEVELVNPLDSEIFSKSVAQRLQEVSTNLSPEEKKVFKAAVSTVRPTLHRVLEDFKDGREVTGDIPDRVKETYQMKLIEQSFPMAPNGVKMDIYRAMVRSVNAVEDQEQRNMFILAWDEILGAFSDQLAPLRQTTLP